MKKILVSQCLYGGCAVRYDGKEKACVHPTFLRWKEEGRLVPVCPEVFGGLSVPRPPAERVGDKVINAEGNDVTEEYLRGAREAVRLAKEHDVAFAIMKEGSPSCGSKRIYDGKFTGNKVAGRGLAVELLEEAGIKVISEEEVDKMYNELSKEEQLQKLQDKLIEAEERLSKEKTYSSDEVIEELMSRIKSN